jgi:hypothetical protein
MSTTIERLSLLQRRPQRVTATINWQLHQRLQAQADEQGRSLSGLIAFVLEKATA